MHTTATHSCTPARLFIQGGKEITSSEGTTQGDPLAMPLYAISIIPLLKYITDEHNSEIRQVAFADDIAFAGNLHQLRSWWKKIEQFCPLLGYYPKACKSWLVVKEEFLTQSKEIFKGKRSFGEFFFFFFSKARKYGEEIKINKKLIA